MIKYTPTYLDNTKILFDKDKELLNTLAISFNKVKNNKKLLEHQEFEFVYVSAKTEGNTYTRAEAITLLERGLTAGGKSFYDAKMLENLKIAFEEFVINPSPITKELIKDIHYILNDGLLEKNKLGIFREEAVSIKGTDYIPPIKREYITGEIEYLLRQYNKIENPFEKAIYIHCNFAYIQPFYDGNKRTARMLQAITLANEDIMPLISKEKFIDKYLEAILNYYETGNYDKYTNFFKMAYKEQYEYLINFIKK